MRSNGLAFKSPGNPQHRHFVDRYREVIAPELHQPLNEGTLAGDGRPQAGHAVVKVRAAEKRGEPLHVFGNDRRVGRAGLDRDIAFTGRGAPPSLALGA